MQNWRLDSAQEQLDNDSMIPDSLEGTPVAEMVHGLGRRRFLKLSALGMLGASGGGLYYYYSTLPPAPLYFDGHYAHATSHHPEVIQRVVMAGNELVDKPYEEGGGHMELFDNAFDCSGSVSHVLFRAGLLNRPLTSAQFGSYGASGPGSYISLFVKPGHHVFMAVCGLRFDTSGGPRGQGPRWRANPRSYEGFELRHPPGW